MEEGDEFRGVLCTVDKQRCALEGLDLTRGGEQSHALVVWNFETTWCGCTAEDACLLCQQQEWTFTVPFKAEAETSSNTTIEKEANFPSFAN